MVGQMKLKRMLFAAALLSAAGALPCSAAVLRLGAETFTETARTVDGGTYTGDPLHNIPAAYAEGEGASLTAENAAFTNGKFTAVAGGELSLKWGLINSPISQINAKSGSISIEDTAIRANGIWASDGGRVSVKGGAISGREKSLISASAGGRVEITESGRISGGGLHADGKESVVKITGVKEISVAQILVTGSGQIILEDCGTVTVTGDVALSNGGTLTLKGTRLAAAGDFKNENGKLETAGGADVTVRGERLEPAKETAVSEVSSEAAAESKAEESVSQEGKA